MKCERMITLTETQFRFVVMASMLAFLPKWKQEAFYDFKLENGLESKEHIAGLRILVSFLRRGMSKEAVNYLFDFFKQAETA